MVRRRSFGRVCVLIARVVAGRTLLHTILRALERVSFNHDPLQFLLVETSYQPLVSFFNLTGMANQHHELKATGERLSVNALGAAGMLLVKSEPELEAVKTEGLGKILRSVGLESIHELQVQTGASAQEADAA